MNGSPPLLVFTLDAQRYALRLEAVERVVSAAEITPLPGAPEVVLGLINLRGRVVPVIQLRRRFSLPDRDIRLSDSFIVASTSRLSFALVADAVHGLVECPPEAVVPAEEILPRMDPIEGVMVLPDGMVLISDLDRALSLEEEASLRDRLATLGLGQESGGGGG